MPLFKKSRRSLDGAQRNPGSIHQTLHRSHQPPKMAKASPYECTGESTTNANLQAIGQPMLHRIINDSERDIRDYVRKRKVSGGTRSDLGRRCQDTFASLKKTCRKLGVSFWEFLLDRVSATNKIPPLGQ
jgi:hypothetical protein